MEIKHFLKTLCTLSGTLLRLNVEDTHLLPKWKYQSIDDLLFDPFWIQ